MIGNTSKHIIIVDGPMMAYHYALPIRVRKTSVDACENKRYR